MPAGIGSGACGIYDERSSKPLGQQSTDGNRGQPQKKSNAKPAKLSRDVQARLGQQLRAMYDDVLNQGVPDRFAELVNRIDGNGTRTSTNGHGRVGPQSRPWRGA